MKLNRYQLFNVNVWYTEGTNTHLPSVSKTVLGGGTYLLHPPKDPAKIPRTVLVTQGLLPG